MQVCISGVEVCFALYKIAVGYHTQQMSQVGDRSKSDRPAAWRALDELSHMRGYLKIEFQTSEVSDGKLRLSKILENLQFRQPRSSPLDLGSLIARIFKYAVRSVPV